MILMKNGDEPGMITPKISVFLSPVTSEATAEITQATNLNELIETCVMLGVLGVDSTTLLPEHSKYEKHQIHQYNSQHSQHQLIDISNTQQDASVLDADSLVLSVQKQEPEPVIVGKLSVITSQNPLVVGKKFWFDKTVQKETSAQITRGTVEVHSFESPAGLMEILKSVSVSQALCSSVPLNGAHTSSLVTKAALTQEPLAIARTKEDFGFASGCGGVLTLDYDPQDPLNALTRDQLLGILLRVCPQIEDAGIVWWCSSSSYIYVGDHLYQGLRGQRFYIMIREASDAARAGKILCDRLWLAGHGHIQISVSGQRLVRFLFDRAMFEPARLDFIGGAVCEPPLRQDRGEPVNLGKQGWLDTKKTIPDLNEAEFKEHENLITVKREKKKHESQLARDSWIAGRKAVLTAALESAGVGREISPNLAQETLAKALDGELTENFLLSLPGGKSVLVKQILENRSLWENTLTLDPLEPQYDSGRTVGKIIVNGDRVLLHSFAHGGKTYRLVIGKKQLTYTTGQAAEFINAIANHLSKTGDIFVQNGALIQVMPGSVLELNEYSLKLILATRFDVRKIDKNHRLVGAEIPTDVPRMILASLAALPFKRVLARVGLPCVTAEGRELSGNGYDERTQLYIDLPPDYETPAYTSKSKKCNKQEMAESLQTLWRPWSLYRFDSPTSRAAMLASILTAVNRFTLDTSPGFAIDASMRAAGKTTLAQSLNALITGSFGQGQISMPSKQRAEDEFAKLILSKTRSGSSVITLDNVTGFLDSESLAALVTSRAVSGRLLHTNTEHCSEHRIFLTVTGNNLQLSLDLLHRFLIIRIEPPVANPQSSRFPFSPVNEVIRNRAQIAAAALTVMRAYIQAGMPQISEDDYRFVSWNKLVRNCVLWIQKEGLSKAAGIGDLGDPAAAFQFNNAAESDPESAVLEELLISLYQRFGDAMFKAVDIANICQDRLENTDTARQTIRACLIELTQPGKEITSISVGLKLQRLRERQRNGLKIVALPKKTREGVCLFRIENASNVITAEQTND